MTDPQPQDDDLSQELRELGELFKRAVRIARDNPQLKDVEQKLSQAMSEVGTQLDRATQTAKEKVPEARERVKQAAQTAKEKVPAARARVKKVAQAAKDRVPEARERVKQAAQTAKSKVPVEKMSERVKVPMDKVTGRVKQAAQAFKETGAPEDFARGLAKTLRMLNEQVRRAIEDIEKSSRKSE